MIRTEREQSIGQGTTELVRNITENRLGIAIPDATISAWISLSRTYRIADDFIDNEPNEEVRHSIYEKVIDYLSGNSEDFTVDNDRLVQEMGYFRSHLDSISVEQRTSFIRNLKNLLKITELVKKTQKPANLAKLNMLEGQMTARLFTSFLPEEFSRLNKYREYLKYFTILSRGVNAFDTLVDFPTDYDQGKITIKPTLSNRAIYAVNMSGTIIFLASHTSPSLIRSFCNGIKSVVEDRTGNSSIHFAKD